MKLTCAGSKKSPTYYVQKSVRIGNKTTTKTVERLGSIEEIKARCGDMDPIEWAKEYTKKLTLAEKGSKQGILLKYSASMLIDKMSDVPATLDICSFRISAALLESIRFVMLSLKNINLITT